MALQSIVALVDDDAIRKDQWDGKFPRHRLFILTIHVPATEGNIVKFADLLIQSVESMPFNENTYVISRSGQADCLIIDPGMEPGKILDYIAGADLKPVAILNTHGHSDHIAGNEAMKEKWPEIPLIIGEGDAEKLTDPVQNLSAPFGMELISPAADQTVLEGEKLNFADIELSVLDTPGHSRGHVVFVYSSPEGQPDVVIGGDVLFNGSIGRTDFPDGSMDELVDSIHNKLFVLPGDTVVLPGHGPVTTIENEITHNPFVGEPAGYSK